MKIRGYRVRRERVASAPRRRGERARRGGEGQHLAYLASCVCKMVDRGSHEDETARQATKFGLAKGSFVARARASLRAWPLRACTFKQPGVQASAAHKAKRPQGRAKGPTRPSPWASAPTSTRSRPTARSMAPPWRARAPTKGGLFGFLRRGNGRLEGPAQTEPVDAKAAAPPECVRSPTGSKYGYGAGSRNSAGDLKYTRGSDGGIFPLVENQIKTHP